MRGRSHPERKERERGGNGEGSISERAQEVISETLRFYEENARTYADSTRDLSISHELYKPFVERLSMGARVLDAGVGAGRDARFLLEQGFDVGALDASRELASLAESYLGISVHCLKHQEVDFREEFDGVWACATLLHVPRSEMVSVLRRYARALKPSGVMYASYKIGERDEADERGRHFTDYTEESFEELLKSLPEFALEEMWVTGDTQSRGDVAWLNVILKKRS